MNPIFKVNNGTYVDLSRITGITFNSQKTHMYQIITRIDIFFEKNQNEMMFIHDAHSIGVMRICDEINVGVHSNLYDLCVGKINEDLTRDYTTIDIPAALEIAKNITIEKYKYLIDAWEEYKAWHSKFTE